MEQLLSALGQALPSAHTLVVDDASADGTGPLLDRIAGARPAVHVLHRPRKLGLGTTRSTCRPSSMP
ncbi:MAG TPA: glycosyltransferase [Polyangiaceae bacterium]|nr:glycosyltransferase [Polyangiaceae bacterium]